MAAVLTSTHVPEPTFRNYNPSSAAAYAQNRPGYPHKLIDIVMAQHLMSGGGTNVLLDVGCGPGTATRSVAPCFQNAVAVDPGSSMIEMAKEIPSITKSGRPVRYEVSAAEGLSSLPALKDFGHSGANSVDLITAATAAHWFDLPKFYAEAAKILKPGGSIILWSSGSFFCDRQTTPNAAKVQQLIDDFWLVETGPYELPGGKLCRESYANLPLPWDCLGENDGDEKLKRLMEVFDEKQFVRMEFNKDGYVAPGERFLRAGRLDLNHIRRMLDTASPVTRWREANKQKVERGEVEDCVDKLVRRCKEAMAEIPGGKGREWLDIGCAVVVLVMKKKN